MWLKARLYPNYRRYLVGNMLLNYDIFKIMKYTGNAEDDSLNLVEIDRSRQFQMGGIKIGNPMPMITVSSKITQTRGIKRLHQPATSSKNLQVDSTEYFETTILSRLKLNKDEIQRQAISNKVYFKADKISQLGLQQFRYSLPIH